MSAAAKIVDPRVMTIKVTDDEIIAHLMDGRTISVPSVWSWRLADATGEQRQHWDLLGDGEGVRWPDIDEDISVEGMLHGMPARRLRGHARAREWQPCEVVLLPFPFSDLSSTKRRDIVALAITSRSGHPAGLALEPGDFELGSLPKSSWVRCDQLHTFDQSSILGRIGKLTPEAYERVLKTVCSGLGCIGGS